MIYVIKEGRIKDNYIKNTKKNVDANLDIAISNNDTKEIIEIKNKCIKALKYINDSKKMKTVKEYYSLPEWILRLLLYCVGIIWIDLDFRGKTKFTKEELVKIEKELNKALDKCNDYIDDHKIKHENAYILTEATKNPIILTEVQQFEINGDKFFKNSGISNIKIKNSGIVDNEIANKLLKKFLPEFKKDVNKFIDENYDNWYENENISKENIKNLANILFDTFSIKENKDGYELEYWISSNTSTKGAKYFFGNHSLVQEYNVDKDLKLIKKSDCYLAG